MKRNVRRFCYMMVAVALAGCGPQASGPQTGPLPPQARNTTLVVENQSTSDMRIYVVASGRRIRLGSVTGNRTMTLRIPASVVGGGRELSFQADPLAGRQVAASFSIFVAPGEEIHMTVPPSVR
jgi:predicted small lipoprotein YifL